MVTTARIILLLALVCTASEAFAQTWEHKFSDTLTLSSGGTDETKRLSLVAPTLGSSANVILPGANLTFPSANGSGVLTNPGTGILTWSAIGVSSLAAGSNNTFLTTGNTGTVGWSGISIDGSLTGNGIGSTLGINLANGNIWTAAPTVKKDAIGVSSTDGVILTNSTVAAAGAQQYSPRLRLTGQGWKTTATAASQTVDWMLQTVPVQGATNPTSYLDFEDQINGGGYGTNLALFSSGAASLGSITDPGAAGVLNVNTGLRVANAAASGNYLRGNGTNFVSSAIQAGDLPGSFNGFANPSTSVGLSTVNGSASTAMRSDAAPAIDQTITPT